MSDTDTVRMKLLIGITGPDKGGSAAWFFASSAIRRSEAKAIQITPKSPARMSILDGLVLGGGADVGTFPIAPADDGEVSSEDEETNPGFLDVLLYPVTWTARKMASLRGAVRTDSARDALEFELLEEAVERQIPVLGICRGAQLINVYFGGTLHRSLSPLYVEEPELRTIFPKKKVLVEPGSKLAAIMRNRALLVNALHRQGVDQLGKSLRIVARDKNGIVQAVEHLSHPFMIGVQWHPEYLPHIPEQQALFQALCDAARAGKGTSATLSSLAG